jgi:uncharacterized protein (TIGR00251 family)
VAEPLFEVEGGETTPAGGSEGSGRSAGDAGSPAGRPQATILLRVHVQPAAGRAAVVGRYGDALHVRVAAPPVGGRANAAAADLVAEVLDVKPAQVELAAGEKSRSKRFRVREVDTEEIARRLELAIAQASRRDGPQRRDRR